MQTNLDILVLTETWISGDILESDINTDRVGGGVVAIFYLFTEIHFPRSKMLTPIV